MNEKMHFTSRKIARSMAKYNMKRAGFQRINRITEKRKDVKSPFQENWRNYVFPRGVLG